MQNTTIAAIATAPGAGGIAVVRLSGPESYAVAARVFRPANPNKKVADAKGYTALFGSFVEGDDAFDEGVALFFREPHSYTGEDCAEIHCHGSPVVLNEGLDALFAQGARQAKGGEFTQRAFLNGRMDLIQAEAVADLIDAESPAAARNAVGQLEGRLSRGVGEIYGGLMEVVSRFYAVVDYPDEDIDPLTQGQLAQTLARSETALEALLATFRRGQLLRQGVPAVILGKPNAGKSSLLNALLGYERAIVTEIPGTTRDTVEERAELGGVTLRLIDTAGLRDSDDPIEQLGVERSRAAMDEAALVLLVVDGTEKPTQEDADLARTIAEAGKPFILVRSKRDLAGEHADELEALSQGAPTVSLSARTGEGLEELGQAVAALFPQGSEDKAGELITNARQAEAAGRALNCVVRANQALSDGVTPDALLTDVEEALEALGELTGQSVREDVTDRIFSKFCVGK